MTDARDPLHSLRRPRLLVQAARHGQASYRRERDLRRIAGAQAMPGPVLPALLDAEAALEQTRKTGDAGYDIARHVEVLIALMAEARRLPAPA
ncbi:MAG: hypothetical protein GC186_04950 [Rhodobacteraceae bacterium]|nr:hypothetical protein [Paracoccaceae bacterium]